MRSAALLMAAMVAAAALAAVDARPVGAKRPPPAEFFGVTAADPEPHDFELMGKGEVGTYTLLVPWNAVQPTEQGGYNWDATDLTVGRAAAAGMQPFPRFYGSPPFAARETEALPLGASARRAWRAFVRAAVERYGRGGEYWTLHPEVPYRPVREWQLWNEQNSDYFVKPRPSPRKYATFLRVSKRAIEKADPRARVVLGGMFGFPGGRRSLRMEDYLRKLYRVRGVGKRFDAVALHPYGGTLRKLKHQIKRARRIMNRNGDRGKPIYITEIGWSTEGPRRWQLVTSKKGQAKRLREAFRLFVRKRARWKIKRVIWYVWRDFERGDCRWCGGAGLMQANGNPKPSFRSFKRFTSRTR